MRWLGISFPESTLHKLQSSDTPLNDSVQLCAENLSRILAARAGNPEVKAVPLGVNVESVSIRKEEIVASIDLLNTLWDIVVHSR